VCNVDYYLNGKQYVGAESLNIILKGLPNGEYELGIQARLHFTAGFGASLRSNGVVVKFTVDTGAPSVFIIGSQTYSTNEAKLNVTTDMPDAKIAYSLDGQANVTLPSSMFTQYHGRYECNLTLSTLSDGPHTLTAYATDALGYTGVSEKTFTVKTVETQPQET
jgi:hypothetical protein